MSNHTTKAESDCCRTVVVLRRLMKIFTNAGFQGLKVGQGGKKPYVEEYSRDNQTLEKPSG